MTQPARNPGSVLCRVVDFSNEHTAIHKHSQVRLMATVTKTGTKLIKYVGIAAVIGIFIAVGRIVFRVFSEKSGAGETHEGV